MNDSHDSGAGATRIPVAAVDFDGVLYKGEWKGAAAPLEYGAVVPGAKEGMKALREKFHVVIFTCRAYSGMTAYGDYSEGHANRVADWLKYHDIPFDEVTQFPGKLTADIYIDDKAIPFAGDWFGTVTAALSFRHWLAKPKC